MSGSVTDRWASGDLYEPYVGRWSRLVAPEFLAWLAAPSGLDWLDVGCGTGVLAGTIAARCAPRRLTGIDPSAGFLVHAQRLGTGIALARAGAEALPFRDAAFDRAVSGLVLNFVPDPARALAETARVVRRGGKAALYIWDYAGKMEMMRRFWDAAGALDPAAVERDEGRRFPICRPKPLRELLTAAGFIDVDARAIDVPTVFQDFDDYWTPFLSGQAPAPGYCMSLGEEARAALRERLRTSLPVQADGSIHLIARAWAVRGTRT